MARHKYQTGDLVDGAKFMRESQTEAMFQTAVTDYATLMGWTWHHETDSRKSKKGLPDFIALRDGRMVVAEFKREKGGLYSEEQLHWMSEFERLSWRAGTVRELIGVDVVAVYQWKPSDWPEIQEVLR